MPFATEAHQSNARENLVPDTKLRLDSLPRTAQLTDKSITSVTLPRNSMPSESWTEFFYADIVLLKARVSRDHLIEK